MNEASNVLHAEREVPEFAARYPNLANARLGAEVILVTDEFFAERSRLAGSIETGRELETLLEESQTLLELSREGEDVAEELGQSVAKLEQTAEAVELSTLLSGEPDAQAAIVEQSAATTSARDTVRFCCMSVVSELGVSGCSKNAATWRRSARGARRGRP